MGKGINKMQTKVQILAEWEEERQHKAKQKKTEEESKSPPSTVPIKNEEEQVKSSYQSLEHESFQPQVVQTEILSENK